MTGTNGHVAACTCNATHVQTHAHVSICTYVYIHTPLRCTYSGLFHSLCIPLAISHRKPQLLLISWVTRLSRWASALGGTAVEQKRVGRDGGLRLKSCNTNSPNICAPCLRASVLNCITLHRDPWWTPCPAPLCSEHAFLRFPLLQLTFSIIRLCVPSVVVRRTPSASWRVCMCCVTKDLCTHCRWVIL